MSTATRSARATRQRLLLYDIDWRTYTQMLRIFERRPSFRLTYDRGALEIMSPLFVHERGAHMLGRFVDVLSEELNVPVMGGRSTTLRLRKKERGLEPDNCWWIASEAQLRGKRRIDLRIDPPPDLAIEVDVTHSSLDRLGIYSALKVSEVWRLDKDGLTFLELQADGNYAAIASSRAFPLVTPADLLAFLDLQTTLDETTLIRRFRAWVRQRIDGTTP